MAKLFKNNQPNIDKNSTEFAVQQYSFTRRNILTLIIFSLVNVALFIAGSDTYFLFSATIPYFGALDVAFSFGYVYGAAVCLISLLLFFLCWLFSKKNPKWMLTATVLFSFDCLVLIYYIYMYSLLGVDISTWILDIIFHVLILLSLINSLKYSKKYQEAIDENGNVIIEENNAEISQNENNDVISENTENTEVAENTEQ